MTTYYVSTAGNDASNGLGQDASAAVNKPWRTIQKALGASGAASGDTIRVGPGVYREIVLVAMTSPLVETQVIADPRNLQGFRDSSGVLLAPREVVLTAYLTSDTAGPDTNTTLTLNNRDFLTFRNFTIVGGNASPSAISLSFGHSVSVKFYDCKVITGALSNPLISYTGLADIASNVLFEGCRMFTIIGLALSVVLPASAVADYSSNLLMNKCLIDGIGSSGVQVSSTGAQAFFGGGVTLRGCVIHVRLSALTITSASISTTLPCAIYDSLIVAGGGPALNANTLGQLVENYNRIVAQTERANVAAGANSSDGFTHAMLFDLGFAQQLGFAPRAYWEPMEGSPLLGFGGTGVLTTDVLGRPKPAGGQSLLTAVGAYERHDTAVQETTTYKVGPNAVKIIGPGDHDFDIPVDAVPTSLSLYVRYDTNHGAGTKPQVTLLANDRIGVSAEALTMSAAVDTWQLLTFTTFTPTSRGVVTIRCISRPAAGSGIAYFDTVRGGGTLGTQGMDYFRYGEPIRALVRTSVSELDFTTSAFQYFTLPPRPAISFPGTGTYSRQVEQGTQYQGESEGVIYGIDVTNWGDSPTSVSIVVKDVANANADVSSTVLTGDISVVGNQITLKRVSNLTRAHKYRVEVQFTTTDTIVWECFFFVVCGE